MSGSVVSRSSRAGTQCTRLCWHAVSSSWQQTTVRLSIVALVERGVIRGTQEGVHASASQPPQACTAAGFPA